MKTPLAPTRVVLSPEPAQPPGKPAAWGEQPARIVVEAPPQDTPAAAAPRGAAGTEAAAFAAPEVAPSAASPGVRERLRSRAPIDLPQGKALERMRQFNGQRGLPEPSAPGAPAGASLGELRGATAARARGAAASAGARGAAASLGGPAAAGSAVGRGAAPVAASRAAVLAHAPGETAGRAKAPQRMARALQAAEAAAFRVAAQRPVWRELGPTLIPHGQTYGTGTGARPAVSGRCNGLVVDRADPRHLVLCSAGGGLWGSLDAGTTWTPLTDRQPTLVMGAIAQSPSSPNVMYAATGEGDAQIPYGVGLLRSSDAGISWSHVPSPVLTGVAVYALAVHPVEPLEVWIASNAGLHVSRNGGASVRTVLDGPCWSVSIHPLDPGELLAAVEGGLMRSTDGGERWRAVSLPGATRASFTRLAVAHAPSRPDVAYAAGCLDDRAVLWRRTTAAGAFAAERVPGRMDTTQAWYDWTFGIAPHDADQVYWGAIDLYRGKRGTAGFRWTGISSRGEGGTSIHPDQHGLAFELGTPGTVYACNDGGVFRSRDSGDSWESLNPGLGITEFEYLAQLESDAAWLLGGTQDNGSLAHAGMRHWDQIALGDGGDCASVDRGADSLCYHSYYDMPVERATAHGGQAFDWTDVSPPTPEGYACLFYPPLEARGRVLVKAGATLWVSADEGAHWSEVRLPTSGDARPDLASALAIVDDATVIIGTASGRLYKARRGAAGWDTATVAELAPLTAAYVADIAVAGTTGRTLWVACSRAPRSGGRVFRSTDGGRTWSNRSSGLPDLPVNALALDPRSGKVLYAATDRGVQRSRDAGASWSDFGNGLPHVIVGDLLLHAGQRKLRAGTRSRGAWEVDV